MKPLPLILLTILYLLPTILAWTRHQHNATAITVLNLLAGWTLIGWLIALIWSLTNPAPTKEA